MEDTEWNDILREKGIIPSLEKLEEDIGNIVDQHIAKQDPFKDVDIDDLDEDDDFMLEYKRNRMKQLRHRNVCNITKAGYNTDVTEHSQQEPVIVWMHSPYDSCQILDQIQHKYPMLKCCKIVASECIAGYPDKNVPTLIAYADGELIKQFVGLKTATFKSVEKLLGTTGVITVEKDSSDEEDEQDSDD